MLLTILILLFVAQPPKGLRADTSGTVAKNQTDTEYKNKDSSNSFARIESEIRSIRTKDSTQKANDDTNGRIASYTFWLTIATALLFAVTAIIALINFHQTRAAIRQADIAQNQLWQFYAASERDYRLTRDNSRKELRAYISITTIHDPDNERYFGVIQSIGVRPKAKLLINPWIVKNNGQTPAHNFRGYWWAKVRSEGETVFEPRPIKAISTVTLSKGSEFPVNMDIEDLSPAEINALMKGKGVLYVWGSMIYDDAFGESHETNFRYEVRWFSHRAVSVAIMDEGNSAT